MTEISRRDLLKTGAATGAAAIGLSASIGSASATTSGFILTPTGPGTLLGALSGITSNNTAHGEALWDQIRATALEMEFQRNSALGSIQNDTEMLAEYLRLDVAVAIVESAESDPGKDQTTDDAVAVLDKEVSNIKRNFFNFWTTQYMATVRRINWVISDDTGEISANNIFQIQKLTHDGATGYPGIYESDYPTESLWTGMLSEYLSLSESIDDPDSTAEDKSGLGSLTLSYDTDHLDDGGQDVPIGHSIQLEDGETYPIPLAAKIHANDQERWNGGIIVSPMNAAGQEFDHQPLNPLAKIGGHMRGYYDSISEGWGSSGVSGSDSIMLQKVIGPRIHVPERQDGDESIGDEGPADILDAKAFMDVIVEIDDVYQQESSNIATMVDNLYDAAANGEISAEDIASGSALKEAAQEGDDWQAVAGYYRGLGLAESDAPARIEIEGGTIEAEGMLFRTVSDDSTDPLPLDEAINFTEQEQTGTDENGDPIMSDVWPGGLHAALRITAVNSDDPLLDQTGVSEGDVGTFDLSSRNVTIVESDEDPLTFEDRGLFEPTDSTDDIIGALTKVYDKEQESRSEDTNITVDFDPGGIPGLPDAPDLSKIVSGLILLIGAAAVALGITSGDGG